MLLQIINRVVKQQIKSLIIISLFLAITPTSFSQNTPTDTAAFKRDFEKLLSKYGLSNKSYLINVTSNNQKGGQTAFIINNNFYGDTLSERNNIDYVFDTAGNHITLTVAPKKGIWTQPFVFADSSNTHRYFDVGVGVAAFISDNVVWVVDKWRSVGGGISQHSVSHFWPLIIELKDNDPNQYFIFGDFLDPNKTFLFYKDKIQYWGTFTEEEFKKLPPMPKNKDLKRENRR